MLPGEFPLPSSAQIEDASQGHRRGASFYRESVLMALARLLPPKASSDDDQLVTPLNQALEQETSGAYDGQGLVPKIRLTMSACEASDIYMRLLAADR